MNTLIIVAAAGWLLFAITAFLYFVGSRLNSNESNALAIYSLAILLSEEFRTFNQNGFEEAIREGRSKNMNTQGLVYGLILGVTNNAKKYYKNESGNLNTISLVTDAVDKTN